MSVEENKLDALTIDPPENQGGGGATVTSIDNESTTDKKTIDPPENQGGGNT
jgi:hypothetical protein